MPATVIASLERSSCLQERLGGVKSECVQVSEVIGAVLWQRRSLLAKQLEPLRCRTTGSQAS